MPFASFYSSSFALPSQGDDKFFDSISKSTSSHEEALLLEEPTSEASTSDSEESEATTNESANERSELLELLDYASSWKQAPLPVEVEGVALPAFKDMQLPNGGIIRLYRNGHGVRTVRGPFGITIHVYVATLYTPLPIKSEQDVDTILSSSDNNDNDTPSFLMEFTFLRNVTPSQMSMAWNFQLDTSITADYHYPEYEEDRAKFLGLLGGPMAENGTMVFEFYTSSNKNKNNPRLILTNQGEVAGEIQGLNFQKAFASMWFGDQPVMQEIKDGLLLSSPEKEEEESLENSESSWEDIEGTTKTETPKSEIVLRVP